MQMLVVYYSRDGHTRKVGEELSRELQCDAEEIIDTVNRSGPVGWLNAGRQAGNRSLTKLEPIKKDPAKYDLVIIGTPIWARNMSTPIRTYITENKDKLKNVAFFCTEGSTGHDKAFAEMEELCSKKPKATLVIMANDFKKGDYPEKVKSFAGQVKA